MSQEGRATPWEHSLIAIGGWTDQIDREARPELASEPGPVFATRESLDLASPRMRTRGVIPDRRFSEGAEARSWR